MDCIALKEHLGDLDYPNIKLLNAEQVADIFNGANRVFFTTWAVKKLGYKELPNERPKLELALADAIHENGFCTSSQKHHFIKVDDALHPVEQLFIITRMLKYLKDISKLPESKDPTDSKASPTKTPPIFTSEDLKSFINTDLNLFPTFGPLKSITTKQRDAKMKAYNNSIQTLEEEIEALKLEVADVNESNRHDDKEAIDFNELKSSLLEFQKASNNLCNLAGQTSDDVGFKLDFNVISEMCANEVQIIKEYMKNMKDLSNFKLPMLEAASEGGELFDFIEKMTEVTNELTDVVQEN